MTKTMDISCAQYELSIEISASRERVWQALLEEINGWWLPDFHMVAADSTVEFDVTPGGRGLVEHRADGSFLKWFAVQFYQPADYKIYLVGNIAPEWGGPSTSNLCLALIETEDGCALNVTDTHLGVVNDEFIRSLEGGWKQLFTDGLAQHVAGQG